MAVLTASATAATVNTLITDVRRLLGDNFTTAAGQKFSPTDIMRAIDNQLALMWNELYEDAGPMLATTNVTYTADAYSVALPTSPALGQLSIYKVEDIDNSANPLFIDYVDVLDIDRDSYLSGWTIIGESIVLRPRPAAAKTLRISYLRSYVPISGSATPSTDQSAAPANHEEYLATGAAIVLGSIDDEVPSTRLLRYEELKKNFQTYAMKFRGPSYVRDTRQFG